MEVKDNIIYFDNDEEFYDFAVVPVLVVLDNPPLGERTDFNWSNQYLDSVNAGKQFCIKDTNSQIAKRGAVSYRTITKFVDGLKPWYGVEEIV